MTGVRPQLIVLTPVRNEAWVLRAFLTCTSLWADKIIIADQMSTDGSREIYKEFPKVQVIDNNLQTMHQAATRRLLFEEVRKYLKGNTNAILFALDADEFFSGNFLHSESWSMLLNSKPNDCFCWRWMNLNGVDITKYSTHNHFYWAVHVSDTLWNGMFPDNLIHEWRLPWPNETTENDTFNIDDTYLIHFARINLLRQKNKERFYQVSSIQDRKRYNYLNLYKQYHSEEELECYDVPNDAYVTYQNAGIDIWSLVDLSDDGQYYTDVVLDCIKRDGAGKYALLDIWDDNWCKKNGLDNPQKWYHKLLLKYFAYSATHNNLFVKVINRVAKL